MAVRARYDVIVLGLGGMGSSAAYHLARRGRRVLGLEQFGVAHDRGSSHGGSRIIRQAYFEDPAYVPLLLRAYRGWAELRAGGADLLTVTGGITVGRPDSELVQGVERSATQWSLPFERWSRRDAAARIPAFAVPEGAVTVFERRAGYVRPEATVRTHVALAVDHGADLRFGTTPAVVGGRRRWPGHRAGRRRGVRGRSSGAHARPVGPRTGRGAG